MKQQEWSAAQRQLRRVVRGKNGTRERTGFQPLVSVIVVCWNAADVLGRCLEHLFVQNYSNYEIIAIDDGSDDGTARIAEQAREHGELTLVRSPRNRGCPAARNLGLSRAAGEIVAFVDADGFAAPDWLTEVVLAFGDDPKIGGVASTVFYDDNPLVVNGAGGTANRQGWAADLSMNESYEHASLAAEALYPMGCGMALRREALERVGPFDDRMLNYYDDVDYGTRLWRAGFRVVVAADAWIDHGVSADDSSRKRLWCERHRMRVVLKHAPLGGLAAWARWELRDLRAAPTAVRAQKLRAIGWNARHLPSALATRRELRDACEVPDQLIDETYGDRFPVGVPLRLKPAPELAAAAIDMAVPDASNQLLQGWFPVETVDGRSYRWATTSASALLHLDRPARRLRLDYAHVPVDIGGIDLRIRRIDSADPLASVWQTRLAWQYLARSVENHPLELVPGDYEVTFGSGRGWSDPPRETRSLSFALSSLSLAGFFDPPPGGLDMASAQVEQQLVRGWFEAEDGPAGRYRWATGSAAAVVRVAEAVESLSLSYCFPPSSVGRMRVALTKLGRQDEACSVELPWRDGQWHVDSFAVSLAPGDYLLRCEADRTWSNPEGSDPALTPENRSLAFALASLTFA